MSRTAGPTAMLSHVGQGRRDVERIYSAPELVAKLRRLADALEFTWSLDPNDVDAHDAPVV